MLEKIDTKSISYSHSQESRTAPAFFIHEATKHDEYFSTALLNISIAELQHHYPQLANILEKIDPDVVEEEGVPISLICANLILKELKAVGISIHALSRKTNIALPILNNILKEKTNSITLEVFWKIIDEYLAKTKNAKD